MDKEVKLRITHCHRSWTVYSRGEWGDFETLEQVYKLGDQLKIYGFFSHRITEITDDHIVIEFEDDKHILTHEKPIWLVNEIEGREWSDGCVYEGDDYKTEIAWLK